MKDTFPPVYYSDYLGLDKILNSQHLKSQEYTSQAAHEEMLFIIVHQAYELWFKQILHDLDSIVAIFSSDYVNEKNVGTAVARLKRIIEIQKLLIDQLHILETMAPIDFLEFRDYLVPASGFQSYQFRMIENKLGLRPERRKLFDKAVYHSRLSEEHRELIVASEKEPNLFDLVNSWLERTPFLDFHGYNFWNDYRAAVENVLHHDRDIISSNPILSEKEKESELTALAETENAFAALFDESKHNALMKKGFRRLSHKATQAALLINLYRDEPILQLPFSFLTALIEIDELWTAWRHRHALMVQRMIGTKIGTGGSSGHAYLKVTADSHKVFRDFTEMSTFLIPRAQLPQLPQELKKNLGFYYAK